MARANEILTNFLTGELTPFLHGRVDTERYKNAVKTCENYIVKVHGGLERRAGTHFVAETKDSSKKSRLIRFEFNRTESYVLEFGNLYIRIYAQNGQVVTSTVASTTITAGGSGYTSAPTVTFTAPPSGTTATGTATVASGAVTGITITNAGTGYSTAPTISFTGGGGSAAAATATLSTGTPVEVAAPWTDAQLGELQVAQSADVMYIVHPAVSPRKLSRTGGTVWALTEPTFTAPKWDATKGYPRAITFHQQRLWFGGTTEKPQSIFGSKSDAFEDFTVGTTADDALEYAIASYRVNQVQWMSSTEVMIVGTAGGEFKVSGGGAALTPSNVQVTRQTSYGGKNVQPRHVGYQTLFIDGTGTKVRSYEYQFNQDIYESEDLTFLAEHVTTGGISEMAYQSVPDEIIWSIRADGTLLGMTYNKGRQIVGWHRHVTDGTFESVATIPKDERDQVWVISKRTIGGATKRFVEYLDPDIHVDSGLTYAGSAITTITGLNHLEGKTVSILGDDAVYPDATVSSGSITLSSSVTKLSVGLKYTSTMTTLPLEGANPAGTAQGRRKRWNEIFVRLNNSFIPKINSIMPPVRSPSTGMTTPEPKMTGDVRVQNTGYDLEGKITVSQDLPGPTHLIAIFGTVSVNPG